MIPSLGYSITDKCNMKCIYCPPYGENYFVSKKMILISTLKSIFKIASKYNFETIRITGGEPLLFWKKRTYPILKYLSSFDFPNVRINTNGLLLSKYIKEFKELKLNMIKVSLDSINFTTFTNITRNNQLKIVLKSLDKASDNELPIELNLVYTKLNFLGVDEVIRYCDDKGFNLKVLDLVKFPNQTQDFFKKYYESPKKLIYRLRETYGNEKIIHLSSNRGIPMFQFRLNNKNKIIIKDGNIGTTFSHFCNNCDLFPCREGLFCSIINSDGLLKICKYHPKTFNLNNCDENILESEIIKLLNCYKDDYYVERIDPNKY